MEWSDDAIVLNLRAHGESSGILEALTRDHGRHLGLVRGGSSSKGRAMLQPGNRVKVTWRARLSEHLGIYTVELALARASDIFEQRAALCGLNALSAIAAAVLPEREPHESAYEGADALLDVIAGHDFADWAPLFVRWEIALLNELGFGLDLARCAATGTADDLIYVSPRTGRAVSREAGAPYRERLLPLPAFLLGRQAGDAGARDFLAGLQLTTHFLEQWVLTPHDKAIPEARQRLTDLAARAAANRFREGAMGEIPFKDDIRPEPLGKALSERYLAYALSTITSRALPDARDGLKPVHRRVLHAMRELGLNPAAGFKKCARVVGDVIGKFHPHGDQSVYDALVRLAQDFAVRYPLVEGQGNFGNVDGDNPAAMRYTESRLTAVAEALLSGIEEDAVDFRATYDGEEREPVVLPAAFPNLLANGSTGIAVGMATSIPPHNAGELCQALIALVENPKVQDRTLFKAVKGPDFPTGGIIVDDPASIQEAYRTGRGSFRVRARWLREEGARGTYQIVVDQIPYQVQKAKLIERIAQLIEEKKLSALDDVRDESTEDIRIVLVPKSRTVEPEILMEQLFRQTELESRFPLNLNVLDKGVTPRVMSLREALQAFIDHRRDVLGRRSRHRLERIADRLEVLEGYLAVYLNLDKVIKIIRTEDEPKPKLMAAFKLTDRQAEAILNMRLRALRKLEEMQIREEHTALTKEQKELKRLLASERLQSERLIEEIKTIDQRFGLKTQLGKRRTVIAEAKEVEKILAAAEEVAELATAVEREPITIVCSDKLWIRTLKGHQEQNDSIKYREGDRGRFWLQAQTTDRLMLFATDGRFFTLDCAKLPGGRGLGEPLRDFVELPPEADILAMFVHREGRKLLLGAMSGHGFVTSEDDAMAMTRSGKKVMNVPPEIEATVCAFVDGDSVAVLGENKKLLIFPLDEVPELARGRGVILQRYKDGHLVDARVFTWKEGLRDTNGRTFTPAELKEYRGARAQAGRIVPRGFARSIRLG